MPVSRLPRLTGLDSIERYKERPTQAFLICTDDLRVVHASKTLACLLRLPPEIAGYRGDVIDLLAESASLDEAAHHAIAGRLHQARIVQADCSFDIASGVETPLLMTVTVQKMGGMHWIISFDDLSARQEAEARIVSLTLTDSLTGLGNRMRFRHSVTEALHEASGGARPIALVLIDLDRFKAVTTHSAIRSATSFFAKSPDGCARRSARPTCWPGSAETNSRPAYSRRSTAIAWLVSRPASSIF